MKRQKIKAEIAPLFKEWHLAGMIFYNQEAGQLISYNFNQWRNGKPKTDLVTGDCSVMRALTGTPVNLYYKIVAQILLLSVGKIPVKSDRFFTHLLISSKSDKTLKKLVKLALKQQP